MSRRVVEDEPRAMPQIPLGHEIALLGVAVCIEIVHDEMHLGLAVSGGDFVQERQEVFSRSRGCAAAQNMACSYVETSEKAPRSIAFVLEVQARPPSGIGWLKRTPMREGLHPRLLVDAQYWLAFGEMDVQVYNGPHLLLVVRVVAVTPHLHMMRLDLGILKNAPDGSRADRANQSRGHHRAGQCRMVPKDALQSKVRGRSAGRGNHLMALQRCNLDGAPRPVQVGEALESLFPKSLDPIAYTRSACADGLGHCRDRLALGRQQDRSGSSIKPCLPSLLPHNRGKTVPFHGRELQFHENTIGRRE